MKYLYITIGLLCTFSCKQQSSDSAEKASQAMEEVAALDSSIEKPIMLDDLHYYTLDREACNQYFEQNFGSRAMKEDSPNPFKFIDFQLIKKGQSTINISQQGPFPGIAVGDPKRWERQLMTPAPENPNRYGVHWLALSTSDLDASIDSLKRNGVKIIDEDYKMPHSNERSILCYGPDFNLIVVVESSDKIDGYEIDHVNLLVKDLEENLSFFKDVFAASVVEQTDEMATLMVADHKFVLVEPEAIGFKPEEIQERDPKVFKPDVDHLGFLYKNVRKAYAQASEKGYEFLSPPVPIKYYDKPTLYTFAITYSPDGLQMEMFQEDGRTASRSSFKERN